MDSKPEVMASSTIRVHTPDGTAYIAVMEHEGRPCRVDISIGKAGSNLMAWAHATARLCTLALEKGVTLNELVNELAGVTSGGQHQLDGDVSVRSGPEAFAVAFIKYLEAKPYV